MEKTSIKDVCRRLRKNQTFEENMLWNELRGNKLTYIFRRQFCIGSYILDFYCPKLKIAIELDGNPHKHIDSIKIDIARSTHLDLLGIRTIRFWNSQIRNDLGSVLEIIERELSLKNNYPHS